MNSNQVYEKYEKKTINNELYYTQKPVGDWIIYKDGWQWVISNAGRTRNKMWIRNNSSNITDIFDSSINESNNEFDFQKGSSKVKTVRVMVCKALDRSSSFVPQILIITL